MERSALERGLICANLSAILNLLIGQRLLFGIFKLFLRIFDVEFPQVDV